ncbi:hypothetical protein NDU88_004688 [Pleurodeles waltl]|uniref:Uncharacterized protein n=1 Tax=Pleurodeles waltl TaxID=8319 RepID=A0AAV7MAM2_PLEWA|nr:hypothetical protein NDU88_004688 [Pleurodeles waltl]
MALKDREPRKYLEDAERLVEPRNAGKRSPRLPRIDEFWGCHIVPCAVIQKIANDFKGSFLWDVRVQGLDV